METILEVGNKYRLSTWSERFYVECVKIHNDKYVMMEVDEFDDIHLLTHHFSPNMDWIPYIEPAKPVEWKTFLVEFSDFKCIGMYLSAEAAKSQNTKAISITEIKLNFEIVWKQKK